jgi:hypothetical protein
MTVDPVALVALHGHFLVADAVKQAISADVPVDEDTAARLGDELTAFARFWSGALRLQVFYALLYVIVEGYTELGCQDSSVDPLLAQPGFLEAFRRFRNAIFHFQEELTSPKLLEFLDTEGSEDWTNDLYRALKAYFERQLPIKEWFDSLPKPE